MKVMTEIIESMLEMSGMPERILGLLAGVSMVVCLLSGCQPESARLPDSFDEEKVKEKAMCSIDHFNARDYQGILDMGCQEMKEFITAEEFAEQCDPMLDKRGKFREIKKTVFLSSKDKKKDAEYGGTVMVGDYENGRITYHIMFDENMEMVEFLVQ